MGDETIHNMMTKLCFASAFAPLSCLSFFFLVILLSFAFTGKVPLLVLSMSDNQRDSSQSSRPLRGNKGAGKKRRNFHNNQGWQNNPPQGWHNNPPQGWHDNPPDSWQNNPPQGWQNNPPQDWQNNPPQGWPNNPPQGYNNNNQGTLVNSQAPGGNRNQSYDSGRGRPPYWRGPRGRGRSLHWSQPSGPNSYGHKYIRPDNTHASSKGTENSLSQTNSPQTSNPNPATEVDYTPGMPDASNSQAQSNSVPATVDQHVSRWDMLTDLCHNKSAAKVQQVGDSLRVGKGEVKPALSPKRVRTYYKNKILLHSPLLFFLLLR